jgi:hypothetical protein
MNKKSKERRVINISKQEYDIIKKYCDEKTLCLSKWIVKLALEKIKE